MNTSLNYFGVFIIFYAISFSIALNHLGRENMCSLNVHREIATLITHMYCCCLFECVHLFYTYFYTSIIFKEIIVFLTLDAEYAIQFGKFGSGAIM